LAPNEHCDLECFRARKGGGNNDPSHLELEELGGVPATQPYGTYETYGAVAEEGWCDNISTCRGEQLPQYSISTLGPQAIGIANDWLIGGLAGRYVNDPDVIFATLVYQQFSSGRVGLQSITIKNESYMSVDLRYVMLIPKINNASNLSGNGNAYIISPPRITPAGNDNLSGPIQPGTYGYISLRPSGNSNNPNNEFSSNYSFTIKYIIGIYGGNAWPPITHQFNP
jgi:hypothetical protein